VHSILTDYFLKSPILQQSRQTEIMMHLFVWREHSKMDSCEQATFGVDFWFCQLPALNHFFSTGQTSRKLIVRQGPGSFISQT